MQVIVFEQQDTAFELTALGELDDLADQLLPRFVGWMRLAGKNEQYRALRIGKNFAQPVEIVEQQRGALVGGEAAGEADGQHRRIGRIGKPQDTFQMRLRALVA